MEKTPYSKQEEIRVEDCSQQFINAYNNNILQEDKQGVTMYLLITPSIRVFENTFFSSKLIYSKNKATVQCRQSEKLCKELAKTDYKSYDAGCSKSLRNPFYFAAKVIKATNFVSKTQHT